MLRKGRMILSSGMLLVMVLTFGGLLAPVLSSLGACIAVCSVRSASARIS